jgi:hypothetical protein
MKISLMRCTKLYLGGYWSVVKTKRRITLFGFRTLSTVAGSACANKPNPQNITLIITKTARLTSHVHIPLSLSRQFFCYPHSKNNRNNEPDPIIHYSCEEILQTQITSRDLEYIRLGNQSLYQAYCLVICV